MRGMGGPVISEPNSRLGLVVLHLHATSHACLNAQNSGMPQSCTAISAQSARASMGSMCGEMPRAEAARHAPPNTLPTSARLRLPASGAPPSPGAAAWFSGAQGPLSTAQGAWGVACRTLNDARSGKPWALSFRLSAATCTQSRVVRLQSATLQHAGLSCRDPCHAEAAWLAMTDALTTGSGCPHRRPAHPPCAPIPPRRP
jgi:hypothetical protein